MIEDIWNGIEAAFRMYPILWVALAAIPLAIIIIQLVTS
jgi:hypothetical protein